MMFLVLFLAEGLELGVNLVRKEERRGPKTLSEHGQKGKVVTMRICSIGLFWLDHCHGFFTAVMWVDSVMDEHRLFGAPNFRMWQI